MDLQDRIDKLEEALQHIVSWSEAYPRNVFAESDLVRAASILEGYGMTLDAISASAMRHCLEGVGKIAKNALSGDPNE